MLDAVGRFAPGLKALLAYERSNLRVDVVAGLSVAAVALPVGIAYADIAGVPAVVGMYSATFPLFAYSLFGSSRQLITGPDAATCILAASAVGTITAEDPERYAVVMVALTFTTGLLYIFAGVLRLGFVANFLSQPILVGYLNGIALIVLIGQLPKLFGMAPRGEGFFPQTRAFFGGLSATHAPTLALGLVLLALMIGVQRFARRLPAALIVAAAGITAVIALNLTGRGVSVLGAVPAGLPSLRLPSFGAVQPGWLLRDAAGVMVMSFASGVLTSKSFARRNGYDIDADQEMIGFGACNLASGLTQGFPVTGADSRTAINSATGGRTQLVGVVAGCAILLFLLFLTRALAYLPITALAAIIIVSAWGLFDFTAVTNLWGASRREWSAAWITTAGALVFGVLPGVLLAITLSLVWLLWVGSRPHEAVLGRMPDGTFIDIGGNPTARTIPGLLIYRWDASLVFFNCEYFKERLLRRIGESSDSIEWVVIDASPVNVVDFTALQMLTELRKELERRAIVLSYVGVKESLERFFRPGLLERGRVAPFFATIESAVSAFGQRDRAIAAGSSTT